MNNYADDFSHVDAWIRTAIRRNAEELDIRVQSSDNYEQFELPKSLFMCKTLMVMKLMADFVASIPTSGCFPRLKLLYVTFHYPQTHSMEKLLSQCPVLEDLTIDVSLSDSFLPKLKRLSISLSTSYELQDVDNFFFINAPNIGKVDIV